MSTIMNTLTLPTASKLQFLPDSLPLEGAVRLELREGVPVFSASQIVQERIEEILEKQRASSLTAAEVREIELYEEVDDYLSLVNRLTRNLHLPQTNGA